jgi:uncharacterized repeat protein (TIGR01451 family)
MLKRIILSSSLVALTLACSPAPDASAYWGTYQYDAQHSGKAPVKGPSIANVKWFYQAPQQVFTNPNDPNNLWYSNSSFRAGITEGPDGTIYTAGDDGRAYAFDPRSGALKYYFDGVGVCCASPVVGKDGTIYFSGNGLFALNPDFTLKFYYPDGGNCCGAITVADDGTVIVGNGWLHAFDVNNLVFLDPTNPDPLIAKTVAPKWMYTELGGDWSVAVSPDGKTVYASTQSNLIAIDTTNLTLNAADGKYYAATKWSVPILNDRSTMPLLIGGNVYVADDQKIIAVNTTTLTARTVISLPGNQVVRMANNGGTLFATVQPVIVDTVNNTRTYNDQNDGLNTLYSINPVTGTVVWTAPLNGAGSDTNIIFDNTGAVYIGTVAHADGVEYMANLYMFTATGTPVFTYTKNTIINSDQRCIIIGMDGTLYTIIDGQIIAFGGTADLSPTIVANPSPVTTNGTLSFTTTVANAGPDTAIAAVLKQTLPTGFTGFTNFVLPTNCVQNSSRVVSCVLGDIPPGTNIPMTFTAKAQSTVGSESTTAVVKSDLPDLVGANNSKTITVPVVAPITCDLTVSAVSGPTAVTRGTTKYSFTATVKNAGTGTCGASTLGFYLSPTTTAAGTQVGTVAVGALAAGASQNLTLSTAVATTKLAAGTFYVGALADYLNVVAETNETNNFKSATAKTTVK